VRQLKPDHLDLYYYRTHQGAESDIVLVKGMKPVACIEIKLSNAPKISKGFYQSISDLKTKTNFVLIPSGDSYPIADKIMAYNLTEFISKQLRRL
jgi:predicted AAA+ superfamily ATPase